MRRLPHSRPGHPRRILRTKILLLAAAFLTLVPADALARAGSGSHSFSGGGRSFGSSRGRAYGGGHHFFFFGGGGGGGGFFLLLIILVVVAVMMSRGRRRRMR